MTFWHNYGKILKILYQNVSKLLDEALALRNPEEIFACRALYYVLGFSSLAFGVL